MTKMLYYCHIMRKLLSYILIAVFALSLFDVVEVNDICLGDKIIFSTTDTDADNPDDDLSSYEYHFSASPLFFAKEIKVAERFETAGISEHLPAKDAPLTGKLNTNNLYRPPII